MDEVGVGPHPEPWPEDDWLDPELLAGGDRRNVTDRYRYWTVEAIVTDLDGRRHPFHVAIENWEHDMNIGTVVRNANAFMAAGVHIVGRRRWNRRGAMVTDRYQHVFHHAGIGGLLEWAAGEELPLIGIDNLPGSVPIEAVDLPERCVLIFGQEVIGLCSLWRRLLIARGLVTNLFVIVITNIDRQSFFLTMRRRTGSHDSIPRWRRLLRLEWAIDSHASFSIERCERFERFRAL